MKSILTFSILLFVANAFAFNFPNISSNDFPSEDGWAKAMTSRACQVKFSKSDFGVIDKNAKKGVVYTVYNQNGQVLASAWARSTFIGAKKRCLLK